MTLSELLDLAGAVVKANAPPDEPDLAPGSEGTITLDTPLGLITIGIQVPAPLRPNGVHRVDMLAPRRIRDVSNADIPPPLETALGTP